eukprot:Clim_evm37s198 gene=Clim_evmTU37s198
MAEGGGRDSDATFCSEGAASIAVPAVAVAPGAIGGYFNSHMRPNRDFAVQTLRALYEEWLDRQWALGLPREKSSPLAVLDGFAATGACALRMWSTMYLDIKDRLSREQSNTNYCSILIVSNDRSPQCRTLMQKGYEITRSGLINDSEMSTQRLPDITFYPSTRDFEDCDPLTVVPLALVTNGKCTSDHGNKDQESHRYNLIHLDPFGSPMPHMDLAITMLADDGVIIGTFTDAGVLLKGSERHVSWRRFGQVAGWILPPGHRPLTGKITEDLRSEVALRLAIGAMLEAVARASGQGYTGKLLHAVRVPKPTSAIQIAVRKVRKQGGALTNAPSKPPTRTICVCERCGHRFFLDAPPLPAMMIGQKVAASVASAIEIVREFTVPCEHCQQSNSSIYTQKEPCMAWPVATVYAGPLNDPAWLERLEKLGPDCTVNDASTHSAAVLPEILTSVVEEFRGGTCLMGGGEDPLQQHSLFYCPVDEQEKTHCFGLGTLPWALQTHGYPSMPDRRTLQRWRIPGEVLPVFAPTHLGDGRTVRVRGYRSIRAGVALRHVLDRLALTKSEASLEIEERFLREAAAMEVSRPDQMEGRPKETMVSTVAQNIPRKLLSTPHRQQWQDGLREALFGKEGSQANNWRNPHNNGKLAFQLHTWGCGPGNSDRPNDFLTLLMEVCDQHNSVDDNVGVMPLVLAVVSDDASAATRTAYLSNTDQDMTIPCDRGDGCAVTNAVPFQWQVLYIVTTESTVGRDLAPYLMRIAQHGVLCVVICPDVPTSPMTGPVGHPVLPQKPESWLDFVMLRLACLDKNAEVLEAIVQPDTAVCTIVRVRRGSSAADRWLAQNSHASGVPQWILSQVRRWTHELDADIEGNGSQRQRSHRMEHLRRHQRYLRALQSGPVR